MASFSSSNGKEDQVLVEKSFVRTVILNKPKAFYAAGDVVAVVHDINNGYWNSSASVFRKEYILFYLMATYCIPQASILNGIVMGAGTGFSIHGSFRVATENFILLLFVFAMPEIALGLFPDIGSSYFLSRIPGHFGNGQQNRQRHFIFISSLTEYLSLTSARLDGAEMLACGLATHFVSSVELLSLEAALHSVDSSDQPKISAVIGEYSELPMLKEQSAYNRLDVINRCFSRRTVEDILYALEQEATNEVDDWIQASLRSRKKASPISLKISLRSIREGRLQGVGQCLVREHRIDCHAMRGEVSKDFVEGCRAVILDKDRNPKWEPTRMGLVTDKMVDVYFSKVDDEDWEELKLPPRPNLPASAFAKL
ncbi:hypothetical protein ACJRO7_020485 [Eucalyptus globulus]|uniref:3-hydroxyisobutyryl-CoA hydrolase n=1 Tax=Eucalyptus globulus TaxID=34317 RepID=A0ABD3KHH6_EUCGL